MDYVFDKLAHLSIKFQSSIKTTSDAIFHTNAVIRELRNGGNPIKVNAVISNRLRSVLIGLEEVGIDIINTPVRRRGQSCRCEIEGTLVEYTKALELELLRRFGEDTDFSHQFTHLTWPDKRPRVVSSFGFDETRLIMNLIL